MFVFAVSGQGGAGRSVTSANLAYQRALGGDHVAYVDFDFRSPGADAVFELPEARRGVGQRGIHSYLQSGVPEPTKIDVWAQAEHSAPRSRPNHAGRLVLFPGDTGGGEFVTDEVVREHCVDFLLRLNCEFDVIVVDLGAGRSYALDLVLTATAHARIRRLPHRWLLLHRWTRGHVMAASDLLDGPDGIIETGVQRGHHEEALRETIRVVRVAVPDHESSVWAQTPPAQAAWRQLADESVRRLAADRHLTDSAVLGTVPLEPVLQWHEQLITEADVFSTQIANKETLGAFQEIARRLGDDAYWGLR